MSESYVCTKINVLSIEEAVKKRPQLYKDLIEKELKKQNPRFKTHKEMVQYFTDCETIEDILE